MINPEHFADWGPNISKVDAPLKLLRKAIPMATLNTTETAWEVNLKTSVELYTIWEMSGVLDQLEGIDENLFDVISDIMSEKRDDWKDYLEDQEDQETVRRSKQLHEVARSLSLTNQNSQSRPGQPAERFTGHGVRMEASSTYRQKKLEWQRLGSSRKSTAFDADRQGSRRRCARCNVGTREGWPDRRASG